jgi:hypothetical protein
MPAVEDRDSPVIASAAQKKTDKYYMVEKLLNLQAAVKAIPRGARFLPLVASHQGVLGSDFRTHVEYLVSRYRHSARKTIDLDGRRLWQRVADFRRSFNDSIALQIAVGHAKMMSSSHWAGPVS